MMHDDHKEILSRSIACIVRRKRSLKYLIPSAEFSGEEVKAEGMEQFI